MSSRDLPEFDEIGFWSELKIDIVRKYAEAAVRIFRKKRFHPVYIDGFAGMGAHVSETSKQVVQGSPLTVLQVEPKFDEYHFVELKAGKAAILRGLVGKQTGVTVHEGDCNSVLLDTVLPRVRYADFRRGLCLLDPYGLHLNWEVIHAAGKAGTIDLFLNFPVMDINRNALWRNPDKVSEKARARMTAFWGDDSWRKASYREQPGFFGPIANKQSNDAVAEAFRKRLQTAGEFKQVPKPLAMRNTKGVIVYYLYFASQQGVAAKIAADIFTRYRARGGA